MINYVISLWIEFSFKIYMVLCLINGVRALLKKIRNGENFQKYFETHSYSSNVWLKVEDGDSPDILDILCDIPYMLKKIYTDFFYSIFVIINFILLLQILKYVALLYFMGYILSNLCIISFLLFSIIFKVNTQVGVDFTNPTSFNKYYPLKVIISSPLR